MIMVELLESANLQLAGQLALDESHAFSPCLAARLLASARSRHAIS